jgi:hypothetical protein
LLNVALTWAMPSASTTRFDFFAVAIVGAVCTPDPSARSLR